MRIDNPSRQHADDNDQLRQEVTIPINQVAEILTPHKRKGQTGLIVKTKDFAYPLNVMALQKEEATDVRLEQGDILLSQAFHGKNKFYLVHKKPARTCYASTFLTVIRPKGIVVVPEYLFFYLQSETIHRYFQLHRTGTFFPRLTLKKLRDLPVIVPEAQTQAKAQGVFVARFLTRQEDIVQQANAELFSKELPTRPIQREFVEELLREIRLVKQEVMERLIKHDLRELEGCATHEYHKSFVILAGSVLEAFLLDWLCELEQTDHFASDKEYTLGGLISQKLKTLSRDLITEEVIRRATRIKDRRNMVHPKVYFRGERITKQVCDEVLRDLSFIVRSRKSGEPAPDFRSRLSENDGRGHG